MDDELLTSDEVLVELKISRSKLDRLLASGELSAVRVGMNGSLRFKRGDLQGLLQPRSVVPGRGAMTRGQLPGRGFVKHG